MYTFIIFSKTIQIQSLQGVVFTIAKAHNVLPHNFIYSSILSLFESVFLKYLLNADVKGFALPFYAESTWVGFKLGKRSKSGKRQIHIILK